MGIESFTPKILEEAEVNHRERPGEEAYKIAAERVSLFQKVCSRLLQARVDLGDKLEYLPPKQRKHWGALKEIPFIRSAVLASEGTVGREPGQRLNVAAVLKKYATAFVLLTQDLQIYRTMRATNKDSANEAHGKEEWNSVVKTLQDFVDSSSQYPHEIDTP